MKTTCYFSKAKLLSGHRCCRTVCLLWCKGKAKGNYKPDLPALDEMPPRV